MHNRSRALFAPDGGAVSGGSATDNAATGGTPAAAPDSAAFDWGASWAPRPPRSSRLWRRRGGNRPPTR